MYPWLGILHEYRDSAGDKVVSGTTEVGKWVERKSRFWRWRGKTTEMPQSSWIKYLNMEVIITKMEKGLREERTAEIWTVHPSISMVDTLDTFHWLPSSTTFLHLARYETCQQAPSPSGFPVVDQKEGEEWPQNIDSPCSVVAELLGTKFVPLRIDSVPVDSILRHLLCPLPSIFSPPLLFLGSTVTSPEHTMLGISLTLTTLL